MKPRRWLAFLLTCLATCGAGVATPGQAADAGPAIKAHEVGAAVVAQLDTNRPFSADGWIWGLECLGKAVHAANIPEQGVFGDGVGSGPPSLRFGKVLDPLDQSRRVFNFTAHRADPRIWGAPRCEVIFSPTKQGRLPVNTDIWFAFGLLLPAWKASADEQIVAQWQMGDGTIAFNPFFAISVQGDALRFQARYNNNKRMSKEGAVKPVDVLSHGLPVGVWTYIVARARISADAAAGPYLQVWRDGIELLSYAGPLGYNISGAGPYVKLGHYHWIDASNPWPPDIPERTVLIRAPSLVVDAAARFGAPDLLGYVKAR